MTDRKLRDRNAGDERALGRDMAALRQSLKGVRPAPELGDRLGRYAREHPRQVAKSMFARPWSWAAVVAIVAIGVTWNPGQDGGDAVPAAEPGLEAHVPAVTAEFIPLGYGGIANERDAFTIVRVKLGRMALVQAALALPLPGHGEYIDADLLLGPDGTVIGIRFVEPRSPLTEARQDGEPEEDSV